MAKSTTHHVDDLLASVTADLLGDAPQAFQDNSLRVERLLLELVRPDPVQPRRVLPEHIHAAFHNNRVTPTQALRELVQIVQIAARQRGRPFNSVLELLPNGDDEGEDEVEVRLSPEENLLRDLVNLAITIRDDGQVNPLTVVDVSQGVTRLFRIETGERRYWATWLLRDFIPNYTGDGTIPCIIIPERQSSVFRQAKENTARSGLTAVALARQAARCSSRFTATKFLRIRSATISTARRSTLTCGQSASTPTPSSARWVGSSADSSATSKLFSGYLMRH